MTRWLAVWLALGLGLLALGPSAPFAPQVITPGPLSGVGLTVTITVPTSATTYDAGTSSTVAVSGTAQSDRTVTGCTYTNSLGGSGSTTGTASWSIASVALTVGSNVLTVTCTNVEGSVNFDVLTITRSASGGCSGSGPTICSTSGTLTNGSTLTITGVNFGTKTTAAPFVFEHLTGGSFTAGKWDDTFSPSNVTTTQARTTGGRNVHLDFRGNIGDTGHLTISSGTTARIWYTSYWFFLASNWTWGTTFNGGASAGDNLANIKVLRWSGPSYPTGDHDSVLTLDDGDGSWYEAAQDQVSVPNFDAAHLPLNTWHFLEQEYTDSSAASAADGKWKIWLDGNIILNEINVIFKLSGGFSGGKRPYDLMFWNSWGSSATDSNDYYETDMYVDTSLARVMICSGSTFTARGSACENQPATSWNSTTVAITLFQGSITSFSGKYLYVVDSTGAVNANGFAL